MINAFPGSNGLAVPTDAAVNNPASALQDLLARLRSHRSRTSSNPPTTPEVELEAVATEAPKFHDLATSSEAVGGVNRPNNDNIMYALMSPSYSCRLQAVRTVISQIPKDLVTGNAFIKTLRSPATYENFDRILNDVAKFLASPLLVADLEFLKEDPEKLCTISSALNMVGNLVKKERKGAKKYEELAETRRVISELRKEVADAEEARKQAEMTQLEVVAVQSKNEKLRDELKKKEEEIAELSRQLASAQMTPGSGQKREEEDERAQKTILRTEPSQATAINAQNLSTKSLTSPVNSPSQIPPCFVLQVPTAAAPIRKCEEEDSAQQTTLRAAHNATNTQNLDLVSATDSQTSPMSPDSSPSQIPPCFVLQVPTAAAPNLDAQKASSILKDASEKRRRNQRRMERTQKKVEELKRRLDQPMTLKKSFEVENELRRAEAKFFFLEMIQTLSGRPGNPDTKSFVLQTQFHIGELRKQLRMPLASEFVQETERLIKSLQEGETILLREAKSRPE